MEGDAREGISKGDRKKKREEGGEDEENGDGEEEDDASLKFLSYKSEGEGKNAIDVLRLNWRTKYACEDEIEKTPTSSSNHWGFFTWFIIM